MNFLLAFGNGQPLVLIDYEDVLLESYDLVVHELEQLNARRYHNQHTKAAMRHWKKKLTLLKPVYVAITEERATRELELLLARAEHVTRLWRGEKEN